jgi:protein-tyrosine phosphatase
MDSANIRNMKAMLGGDPEGKVHKLMEYTARGGDVADPWYTDRFDIAWRDIYEGCAALLEQI